MSDVARYECKVCGMFRLESVGSRDGDHICPLCKSEMERVGLIGKVSRQGRACEPAKEIEGDVVFFVKTDVRKMWRTENIEVVKERGRYGYIITYRRSTRDYGVWVADSYMTTLNNIVHGIARGYFSDLDYGHSPDMTLTFQRGVMSIGGAWSDTARVKGKMIIPQRAICELHCILDRIFHPEPTDLGWAGDFEDEGEGVVAYRLRPRIARTIGMIATSTTTVAPTNPHAGVVIAVECS